MLKLFTKLFKALINITKGEEANASAKTGKKWTGSKCLGVWSNGAGTRDVWPGGR
jgi:hypothetical protein